MNSPVSSLALDMVLKCMSLASILYVVGKLASSR